MRKRIILTACCISVLLVGLDVTAVNLALPSMAKELHVAINGMQWVVASYTLVGAGLLLAAGTVGDRLGYRRALCVGVGVFIVASALCATASTHQLLIVFRVLQAVGASLIVPMGMSVIAHVFPGRDERPHAMGMFTAAYALGMALGPVAGGALVDSVGWRSIFLINVPIGIVVLVLTARYTPEFRSTRFRHLDLVGQLLVIAFLGPLVYAIIEAPQLGWTSVPVQLCVGAAIAAFVALLVYERRCHEPLIDLRYFRSVPFSCAVSIGFICFAAFSGVLFLSTLYLQYARGFSALTAGIWMLPLAVMAGVCGPLSGRLTSRHGTRPSFLLAGAVTATGGLLFALADAENHDVLLLVGYALFGANIGLSNTPTTMTVVAGMPRDRAGVASALLLTFRRVGFTLGVAVMGTLLAAGGWHTTEPAPVFIDAARAGWWAVACCGVMVLLLGVLATCKWARDSAEHTAVVLEESSGRHDRSTA
ncbi:MFS transporter [Streptomyces wuyuanensis]|uniref:MFS transporter n=1 Tax=Streptomyces wuyuanensis TaxID=1196353 RepID=UPI0034263083